MSHSSALRGEDGARLLGDRTALGSQLPNTSTEVLSLEIGLMGTCVCLALIFFSFLEKASPKSPLRKRSIPRQQYDTAGD